MTIVCDCCIGAGGVRMGVLVEALWRMVLHQDWNTISGCSIDVMRLLGFRHDSSDCWDCETDSSDYDVTPLNAKRLL